MRTLVFGTGLALVLACKKEPLPQAAPPPAVTEQPVLREPTPPPAAPGRSCASVPRLQAVVGAPTRDCGRLASEPARKDLDAARTCVRDATRKKESFVLVVEQRGIDSVVEMGLAGGRGDAGTYETYRLDYDGCPMGCGNQAPSSTLLTCEDLRPIDRSPWFECGRSLTIDGCRTPYSPYRD